MATDSPFALRSSHHVAPSELKGTLTLVHDKEALSIRRHPQRVQIGAGTKVPIEDVKCHMFGSSTLRHPIHLSKRRLFDIAG